MAESQPSSIELAKRLQPWFPLFARVGTAVERDVLAAIPLLGLPRKTERANDFHRAWRNNLRRVCDLASQFFELQEEPDGQGLDCLLCKMDPEMQFLLRWGRYNGNCVRRNRTERSKQFQEQGRFWAPAEPDSSELASLTLAHTIEDEFTVVGQSQMWVGRLLLLRERPDESEVVTEVHVYSPPDRTSMIGEVPAPIIVERQNETEEWQRIVDLVRRSV